MFGSKFLLYVAILVATTLPVVENCGLRLATFNTKSFGVTKASKPHVLDLYAKIIQRYDIIVFQEIRDASQSALATLLTATNNLGPNKYHNYSSIRLGRTSYKEQYSFIIRNSTLFNVIDTFQDPDPNDYIHRAPFSVKISSSTTAVSEFILTTIHVDPDFAISESNALKASVDTLRTYWNNNNVLILGDLNADCTYMNEAEIATLDLSSPEYLWLIGNEVDSTTGSTDCSYDRLIMHGTNFQDIAIVQSARIFNFTQIFNLNSTTTSEVSGHYPVEMTLKSI